jgi:hypothetical protein
MADAPHIADFERAKADRLRVGVVRGQLRRWIELEPEDGFRRYPLQAPDLEEGHEVLLLTHLESGVLTVGRTTLPLARSLPYRVADFAFPFESLDPARQERAAAILAQAGVSPEDRPAEKVSKLAIHLHRLL